MSKLEQLAMQWPDDDAEPTLVEVAAAAAAAAAADAALVAPTPEAAPAAPTAETTPVARTARATAAGTATDRVLVATDGSCLRNPGGATGWAYVRSDGAWAYAGRPSGTNQIGELLAVVLALADHADAELEIQCDSAYAIGCATTWKKGWQRNNYINSQKKIVSNLEIIRELHELLDARTAPVTFTKVKGHDLSNRWPLNTAVDIVCGEAALATLESRAEVSDNGVLEIDWALRASRSAGRGAWPKG
jgi:ribonuclease HI